MNDTSVVADPDERLLHLGRWQDGLVPTVGLTPQDSHDLQAFFAAMTAFRDRIGADGRLARAGVAAQELRPVLTSFVTLADELDDEISATFGGYTARDWAEHME